MGSQQSAVAQSVRKEFNKAVLYGALALAAVTAIVHIYTAYTDIGPYGINVAGPLFLIALVYLGGIGLIAAKYKRDLWIKIGIGWVLIVLILWAAAATNTDIGGTRLLSTFIDKGVEVVLLGLLVGLWMMKGKESGVDAPRAKTNEDSNFPKLVIGLEFHDLYVRYSGYCYDSARMY